MSPGLPTDSTERRLLQSIVAVARHAYGAAASSIFRVTPGTGDLVFAAVSGAGEEHLVGTRLPAGTGIAGWAIASGEPLISDDVAESDRFARDAAASTGYVPASIMAAPLVADGECIGVLEVLDRRAAGTSDADRDLKDIELLGLIATQAALGLSLLRGSECGRASRPGIGPLLERLTEHVPDGTHDPLALAMLGLSLELLDRGGETDRREAREPT